MGRVYLAIHGVLMHVVAALVVLVYIPLSVPVRLFLWAFVKPLRREQLRGKVVLITGASSGIGEELAYQYASKGASLALVARRKQALKSVAAAARERGAPDVLVLHADVSDAGQSRRAVEETIAHYGKLNHLVANAGIWSTCPFDEITNITAFTTIMISCTGYFEACNNKSKGIVYMNFKDVNFWGAVYPTYYALPHLKASRGKLVVCSSAAGTVATSRMSFYNASKAAVLRFYETLRAELGSEVGVTILTHGYVESEMTMGKAVQKDGVLVVDEEARDVQIGVFPVGSVSAMCRVAMDGIRRGDRYVTWPSMYRPLQLVACLAPEIVSWLSYAMYNTKAGGGAPLSKRALDATGARRFFPEGLRRNPVVIKTDEECDGDEGVAACN
ncbi:hypothetical protein OsI_07374 [Oryza sativa Indica Group]|uniref:Uncharacterized protein n=1 Tax=Oryza sativa subsp. indica TaxID=39946 RepID=A2X5A3_ORYSI|nr:hypothetical protein OsI_07374 [Oryza sativa Indica Group]